MQRTSADPLLAVLAACSALCLCAAFYWRHRSLRTDELLRKYIQLKDEERRGRIAAEKRLRDRRDGGNLEQRSVGDVAFISIGTAKTPFKDRRGTPRQGSVAPSTIATIVLDGARVSPAALDALDQFSHVWILFWFHENTNHQATDRNSSDARTTFQAKVSPPRLAGAKVGVFSTRSPHRPNPIGLTMAKVESVRKNTITVSGIDLVDGTPLLDIKPVIPYDLPQELTYPDWIDQKECEAKRVVFTDSVQEYLRKEAFPLSRARDSGRTYGSAAEFCLAASEVLSLDIRSVHRGRGTDAKSAYECVLDGVRLDVVYDASQIVVTGARVID